ncbi:alpha-amylase [Candidatus Kaiserbacteria bacterium RIFCSPHIGHO2_02_FULL_55_25]|uniref:Alpha-amylase n=1 Tax=Candidatus Kaiserbacteria bacterium RIFCSPHIGHO2_02_FULL_55_25 TaxID=1798498 RepID=A0A1F6E655_9BACT|nr:MAG: alpha-amylase [Candidatus Kaiserbacteria bacterium RIFCSPHIGHO2_01_FULL_55_79]OGG69101.1 MAG: alpha-amylase [Candidatus Kaiserbacteria bacterium RIFCSPHIGHO2_02_FULL_55_25]OGG78629.1 MAG: alpha-amylase [Candidatus Kaiserbacteria bacterium RIFCSPHIGHO2_12_FULL_55_13]
MKSVCFYFQVHQPYRVKRYRVFDIGNDPEYFNDRSQSDLNNRRIAEKVAAKSYIPATKLMLELLRRHPEMRVSFSFSGVALEQLERYAPEAIELFKQVVDTGRVEILGETYYHSLAFFYSPTEFERQVTQHRDIIRRIFGVRPRVFRNTELSYRNDLGAWADREGYAGIVTEGWDPILGWRSPNYVYKPKGAANSRLLLKNYRLSDDVAFRFSSRDWSEWPLTAEKFGRWIGEVEGDTVNLFMDYETFGEHQWEDTGIFKFLEALPQELAKNPGLDFKTPSEVIESYEVKDEVDIPHILTWADTDRDLTAWVGNPMQKAAIEALYSLEDDVVLGNDRRLLEDWRKLQTSDHFYYMCTKWSQDGDVHAYFSPYESPYDAYIAYMNALSDLRLRAGKRQGARA